MDRVTACPICNQAMTVARAEFHLQGHVNKKEITREKRYEIENELNPERAKFFQEVREAQQKNEVYRDRRSGCEDV